jgi:diguanylate cyclase (GGDEF)-like protein
VRLTGLPPGSYRFEARVADRELGVESPVTGFGFEIELPWWRTPQAYAAAVFGVLLAGLFVHRWQVRRVTGHAAALEVLVQQRTKELEASRKKLLELASRDALTGAWNRRALMEILERELGRARREQLPLTLLLADIDHFKRINDTYGHPAGDAVLREFVKRLTLTVRPYDAVGRFGGEEFLILLPGLDSAKPGDAQRVQALHAATSAEPMPEAGHVTCSFGAVTLMPGMEADADQLIALADQALYRAKGNGRDQVVWA